MLDMWSSSCLSLQGSSSLTKSGYTVEGLDNPPLYMPPQKGAAGCGTHVAVGYTTELLLPRLAVQLQSLRGYRNMQTNAYKAIQSHS